MSFSALLLVVHYHGHDLGEDLLILGHVLQILEGCFEAILTYVALLDFLHDFEPLVVDSLLGRDALSAVKSKHAPQQIFSIISH